MDLNLIILNFGYLAIFILMIINGIISFPSSQVLYLISGWFVAKGNLDMAIVLLLGTLGHTIGNYILFYATKKQGKKIIKKIKIFNPQIIENAEKKFKKKGTLYIFIGNLTPAIKNIIPIPPALSKISDIKFLIPTILASFVWALFFNLIGYFLGENNIFQNFYKAIAIIIGLILTYYIFKNKDKFFSNEFIEKYMK